MPRSAKSSDESAALKREIADLKAEIASLKGGTGKDVSAQKSKLHWKVIVAWACLTLATVILILGNIFFWAGNTVVDTNKYVATVGPLIEKPQIQTGIADYTTTQLFNNVNVQGYVQTTLPPRAQFLAPQLTTQLKSYTQKAVVGLLQNSKVQSYWYSSLTNSHQALIGFAKSYEGNGDIDVSDLYGQLSNRLETTNLSFLANKQLPAKVGSIKVATVGWLPALHKIAKNIGLYQTLATLLFIALTAAAVFLSRRRRRMVIQASLLFALAMLLTLLATRIVRAEIVAKFMPTYQPAIQVAYDTIFHSLRTQTVVVLLISLLAVVVAWISGPYKSAAVIKDRVLELLSGRLHQSIFGDKENKFTLWVGKYKRILQWASVIVIAIIMLLVQLSTSLIIVYALLMLLCVLIIELVAAK